MERCSDRPLFNFAAFLAMIKGADYQAKADPHRRAALVDWRLLATTPMPPPGADA